MPPWTPSATRWKPTARLPSARCGASAPPRERLLAEGDAALAELLDEYPDADRQALRTLVRNALAEKARNKPPRAYREIYQALRELMLPALAGADAEPAADEADDTDQPTA